MDLTILAAYEIQPSPAPSGVGTVISTEPPIDAEDVDSKPPKTEEEELGVTDAQIDPYDDLADLEGAFIQIATIESLKTLL